MKPQKFDSIQGLRGIAALLVFLYHALPATLQSSAWLPSLARETMRHFHIGVDIFFVISGFIMTWTALININTHETPASFIVKRLTRVAPCYWVVTVIAAAFFTHWNATDTLRSMLFQPVSSEGAPFYGYAALISGWTLNYEIYFYSIFAVSLFFKKNAPSFLFTYFFLTLIFAPWAMTGKIDLDPYRSVNGIPPIVGLATNPIVLEFLLGCLAAYIFNKLRHMERPWLAAASIIIAIAIYSASIAMEERRHSLLWTGLPAFFLLIGILLSSQCITKRTPRPLVWFGSISYSFYLLHILSYKLAIAIYPPSHDPAYGALATLVCFIATTFASYFLYRVVELPTTRTGKKLADRLKAPSPAAQPKAT